MCLTPIGKMCAVMLFNQIKLQKMDFPLADLEQVNGKSKIPEPSFISCTVWPIKNAMMLLGGNRVCFDNLRSM